MASPGVLLKNIFFSDLPGESPLRWRKKTSYKRLTNICIIIVNYVLGAQILIGQLLRQAVSHSLNKKDICKIIERLRDTVSNNCVSGISHEIVNNEQDIELGANSTVFLHRRNLNQKERLDMVKCENHLSGILGVDPKKLDQEYTEIDSPVEQARNETQESNWDPFDLYGAKWMDGSSITRTNQQLSNCEFPPLTSGETTVKKGKNYFELNIQNIPCKKCEQGSEFLYRTIRDLDGCDVICFSEMYIKDECLSEVKGYKVLKRDVPVHCALVLVKNKHAEQVKMIDSGLPTCFIEISLKTGNRKSDKITIINGYRSPAFGPFFTEKFCNKSTFEMALKDILQTRQNCLVVGDLNLKFTNKLDRFRPGETMYSNILKNSSFIDLIDGRSTHRTTFGTFTCTDVCLANTAVKRVGIDEDFSLEYLDHATITVELSHTYDQKRYERVESRSKIYKFETDDKTETHLFKKLQMVGEQFKLNEGEFGTKVGALKTYDGLKDTLEAVCPVRRRLIKTGDSAIPLPRLYHEKKLEMKILWKNGQCHNESYKILRKECRTIRTKALRKGRENRIAQRLLKLKGNWAVLDNLLPHRDEIPVHLCANVQSIHFQKLSYDYIEKTMNRPIKDLEQWLSETNDNRSVFDFELPLVLGSKICHLDIMFHLSSARGSKFALGRDGMCREFLKNLPDNLLILVSMMVTVSLRSGEYIEDWREMRSFAVFKKKNRNEVENYRPIHISQAVSACVEKMAILQASKWCEESSFFNYDQWGFRPNRTIGGMVNHARRLLLEGDPRRKLAIILNDISNAFGSSDDGVILMAFSAFFGLRPLRWWRSFLAQTEAQFSSNGESGTKFKTSPRGYPQGSTASPGSFLMLMRNCHQFTGAGHVLSFADDTTFCTYSKTDEELRENLQNFLDFFENFCFSLNIRVNPGKTQMCPLQTEGTIVGDIEVKVCGERIERVKEFNLLGISQDHKLNFKPQFEKVLRSLKYKGHQVVRNLDRISYKFTKILIQSYLHSTIGHGLAYMPLPDRNMCGRLNAQINKCLRKKFSLRSEKNDPTVVARLKQWKILGRCGLPSVENLSRIARLTELNKIAREGVPTKDFETLVSCFESGRENRRNKGIPVLTNQPETIRNCRRKLSDCQPYNAINLLRKLPSSLARHFGTKVFDSLIKNFFTNCCQHSERSAYVCRNCGLDSQIIECRDITETEAKQLYDNGKKLSRWVKKGEKNITQIFVDQTADFYIRHRTSLIEKSEVLGHKFLCHARETNFWHN